MIVILPCSVNLKLVSMECQTRLAQSCQGLLRGQPLLLLDADANSARYQIK